MNNLKTETWPCFPYRIRINALGLAQYDIFFFVLFLVIGGNGGDLGSVQWWWGRSAQQREAAIDPSPLITHVRTLHYWIMAESGGKPPLSPQSVSCTKFFDALGFCYCISFSFFVFNFIVCCLPIFLIRSYSWKLLNWKRLHIFLWIPNQ